MKNNLRHIEVSGFKSIENLSLKMSNVNILIGANGAGKSNFVSLFTFLGKLSNGQLKNYVSREGGAERFFHFGTKQTENIKIHVSVGSNDYYVGFDANVSDDALNFLEEFCKFDLSPKRFTMSPRNGESGFVSTTVKPTGVRSYTKTYLNECRVYHFHDTSSTAGFKKTRELSDNYYLEADAGNIAPFLHALKYSENEAYRNAYQNIIDAIRTIAPFFHDFYLEPVGDEGNKVILLRWIHTNSDNPFSANNLSDGTARFICMATLFLQPEELRPATIILDEPELGLHPAALVVLGDIIKSTSTHSQIICSTQSVTFANIFNPDDFIIVDAKNGVSKFSRPDTLMFEAWLDEYGMGDIWEKNLIGGQPQW